MSSIEAQPWFDADQSRAEAEETARAEFHRMVAAAELRLDVTLRAIRARHEEVTRGLSVAALARKGA